MAKKAVGRTLGIDEAFEWDRDDIGRAEAEEAVKVHGRKEGDVGSKTT